MTMPSPVTISLPFAPSSAAVARHRLVEWMVGVGATDDAIEDSRLVVSELVGNAVRHAAPLADDTLQVTWRAASPEAPDALVIAVTDGGSVSVPTQTTASPGDESGRGLGIVEALSKRWWLETTRSRSTVHALIHLAAPSLTLAG